MRDIKSIINEVLSLEITRLNLQYKEFKPLADYLEERDGIKITKRITTALGPRYFLDLSYGMYRVVTRTGERVLLSYDPYLNLSKFKELNKYYYDIPKKIQSLQDSLDNPEYYKPFLTFYEAKIALEKAYEKIDGLNGYYEFKQLIGG